MHIVRIGDQSTKPHPATAIGAKAANLAQMAAIGLPVPPAFVLPVKLCAAIVGGEAGAGRMLRKGIEEGVEFLEQVTSRKLGDRRDPLLVSVRSGAARSMPGMLDTVLNVGCTADAVCGLIRSTGNPRFAWDCRRRFLEGYAETVLGLERPVLQKCKSDLVKAEGARGESELDSEALERLAHTYERLVADSELFVPDDPIDQLRAAAEAVYRSWMSDRARTYRELEHLEDLQGTAVAVQAMVYGNRGLGCGAGVAFSRDPSSGAPQPVIEAVFDAQGEDVVSGSATPESEAELRALAPDVHTELKAILERLEREFGDVQDVEFTVESGKLWMLQTRAAKRTPKAALRIAIDLVNEGLISSKEAVRRTRALDPASLMHQELHDVAPPVASGIGASSGVAVGRAAFDAASAERLAADGSQVILLRPDTSTADVAGFALSAGIVTALGGRTAHAALVARQLGKPCVVGCDALAIDLVDRSARLAGATIREGDWLSIDGETGAVHLGQGRIVCERPEQELRQLELWKARSHRHARHPA